MCLLLHLRNSRGLLLNTVSHDDSERVRLNDLMTVALDYVLNYLVEFDRIEEAGAVTDIDIDGEEVEFSGNDMFVRTRSLVYLPDSAIDEGGFVTMVAFAMDNDEARHPPRVRCAPTADRWPRRTPATPRRQGLDRAAPPPRTRQGRPDQGRGTWRKVSGAREPEKGTN